MFDRMRTFCTLFLLGLPVICFSGSGAIAQDAVWHVGKSSGDVWLSASSGVQQVSLGSDAILKPGDNIRTGRNGRVLLVRDEETILISPNSAIGIPTEAKEGLSTTIIQQAGSILLDVEKRNVKHFEVETPYLAAVVKGTQFRVSVNKNDATVDVLRGQVEVADFKSGQFALVLPGQAAKVSAQGPGGLSLSGTGTFNPIEKGEPRASSVHPVQVPKEGLTVPGSTPKAQTRIASPLGDVKLNFQKVTKGLARDATGPASGDKGAKETMWTSGPAAQGNAVGAANGNGSGNGGGNGNGNGGGVGSANGNGINAGAVGNGLGQTKSNNGTGNGTGTGTGNDNGNANGNGNRNGNGNGNGNGKS